MSKIRKSVSKLEEYIPGEQPNDDAIKLNTNENPYLPSPEVLDILREIDISDLSLYPDPNCLELRKVIADLHQCSIDQIFVGNGSDEILALAIRAYVERDSKVGYLAPSYSLYSVLTEIEDIEHEVISLDDGFNFKIPEHLDCSLFLLANPNAPTGIFMDVESINCFADNYKGVLLIDEAYVDFAEDNCLDLAFKHSNVIITRSLSKSYSLAGIRCGYCVGSVDLINALYKIKDSYNVNYITQELARVALLDQATMRANVEAIKETRDLVFEKLTDLGYEVYESQTNFLWFKPLGIKAVKLFELLKERNIYIRYFGASSRTDDYLRVTIGTASEMFTFLDALDEIIKSES